MINNTRSRINKRKYERYKSKLPAQLRIWLTNCDYRKIVRDVQHIIAMAETNDISLGGMSLHIVGSAMDASKSLTRANAPRIIGRPVEVAIESEDIVVWGDLIRADMDVQELGIVIYKVSDVKIWKRLCTEHMGGISIFPEGPRINRKRRA